MCEVQHWRPCFSFSMGYDFLGLHGVSTFSLIVHCRYMMAARCGTQVSWLRPFWLPASSKSLNQLFNEHIPLLRIRRYIHGTRPQFLSVKSQCHLVLLINKEFFYYEVAWKLPRRFELLVSPYLQRWMDIYYSWWWLASLRLLCKWTKGENCFFLVTSKKVLSPNLTSLTTSIKYILCSCIQLNNV